MIRGHDHSDPATLRLKDPRPRLLLVDEDEGVTNALRRLLRREPYLVTVAHNAEEAFVRMIERPAQVVLAEYHLSGMSGVDMLRRMHQTWPDTIRLVLSGDVKLQSILDAVNEGAIYKYIAKPWDDQQVCLQLKRAFEHQALAERNRKLTERLRQTVEQLEEKTRDTDLALNFVRALMEIMDAGVINVDPDGLIVGLNERAAQLLSDQPYDLIGCRAVDVIPRPMVGLMHSVEMTCDSDRCCAFQHQGLNLQACCQVFQIDGSMRGRVLTIWQGVN